MPIPDVSGWLHDVRDVPADYRRAGPPERRVDGVTPAEHAAPSEDSGSAPPAERVTPLSTAELLSEVKRLQDLGFEMCERNEQLSLAARRTMRALDGYWEAWEEDGHRMDIWWTTYERWRTRLDALTGAERDSAERTK